jgi:hypothetical protein
VSLKVLGVGVHDVEFLVSNITGDRGGGGAAQLIHPELIRLRVMDESSMYLNCMLHAMQKALETASVETLGPQCMNHNTCFQLVFQSIYLLATIKREGDLDLLKEYYAKTLTKFWDDPAWQTRAADNFVQAFQEMSEEMDKHMDTSDEAIDELVKQLECRTNVQPPNFGRWGSVSAASQVVVKHWTPLYFLAQVVCNDPKNQKKGSYLGKRRQKHQHTTCHYFGSMPFVISSLMSTWTG